jgi:hypothetical protein
MSGLLLSIRMPSINEWHGMAKKECLSSRCGKECIQVLLAQRGCVVSPCPFVLFGYLFPSIFVFVSLPFSLFSLDMQAFGKEKKEKEKKGEEGGRRA